MILVTGGAGFIGSHLVDRLVEQGASVRVLDDLSTGKSGNLSAVAQEIELVKGSITDADAVERAMQGVSTVFHLAACASVARSVEEPLQVHGINATGTLQVLDAARRNGVRKLVFASSSALYGANGEKPGQEDDIPTPLSHYGAQKLIGENYARIYAALHALPTVCLRFFNVFGPRQDPSSPYSGVISLFSQKLVAGQVPEIHGDGGQERDFVFIDNVVDALMLASQAQVEPGSIFNVATGKTVTILGLFQQLQQALKRTEPARFSPARSGDVRISRADVSRAQSILGFEARVEFADGIKRTLEWVQQDHGEPR